MPSQPAYLIPTLAFPDVGEGEEGLPRDIPRRGGGGLQQATYLPENNSLSKQKEMLFRVEYWALR